MMRFRSAIAAVLVASAPLALGAQTASVSADPLYRLDQFTRRQVEAIRDSARDLGLPAHLITLKAIEGRTKGADSKHIVRVVRDLFTNLRVAKRELGTTAGQDELDAAAAALYAGLRPEELAQFRAVSGRTSTMALTVLADAITRLGVSRDLAVSTFVRLWRGGSRDDELQSLQRRMEQDILSAGKDPGASLNNRAREIPAFIRPPGEPDHPDPPER
jgi:hypothetical protein